MQAYKTAMKIDDGCEPALHGLIKCQILEGDLESAEKQLTFINEVQMSSPSKNADICFLTAMLTWRRYGDQEKSVRSISETIEIHFKSMVDVPLRFVYLITIFSDSKQLGILCKVQPRFLDRNRKRTLTACWN